MAANKPEVEKNKEETMLQEDDEEEEEEEEPQLDLMKARKGFDLSEMILGR